MHYLCSNVVARPEAATNNLVDKLSEQERLRRCKDGRVAVGTNNSPMLAAGHRDRGQRGGARARKHVDDEVVRIGHSHDQL